MGISSEQEIPTCSIEVMQEILGLEFEVAGSPSSVFIYSCWSMIILTLSGSAI
jgi:hypothetical protein